MKIAAWIILFSALAVGSLSAENADRANALDQTGEPVIAPIEVKRSTCQCGQCFVAHTPNFHIRWCSTESAIREFATECEHLRTQIAQTWLGKSTIDVWTPVCEICVHSDANSYVRHLGRGAEGTSGCSSLTLDHGRVVMRRIDLRGDAEDWRSESLPHELTHIVLADRFSQSRIPSWADEGISMLAESSAKLSRRRAALWNAIQTGKGVKPRDIVAGKQQTSRVDRSVFYGESVSIVAQLLSRGSPEQLLTFVERGQASGYEQALQKVYGLQGWDQLEIGWHHATKHIEQRAQFHAQPLRSEGATASVIKTK